MDGSVAGYAPQAVYRRRRAIGDAGGEALPGESTTTRAIRRGRPLRRRTAPHALRPTHCGRCAGDAAREATGRPSRCRDGRIAVAPSRRAHRCRNASLSSSPRLTCSAKAWCGHCEGVVRRKMLRNAAKQRACTRRRCRASGRGREAWGCRHKAQRPRGSAGGAPRTGRRTRCDADGCDAGNARGAARTLQRRRRNPLTTPKPAPASPRPPPAPSAARSPSTDRRRCDPR